MVERIDKEEGLIFARDEFQRAKEEIRSAKVLQENGLFFKSVVSSYYAVYHAAKAALLIKGVVPRSHEGVERMFSLYYVKPGEVAIGTGRIIGRLRKLREEADYYPESLFDIKDSKEAIEKAEQFVTTMKEILRFDQETSA